MGRIKELRDKQAAGDITDVELKELKELEMEAKAASDEDSAVEELSDAIAKSIDEKLAPLTAVVEKLTEAKTPEVKVTSTEKFIVDPHQGKISVDQLEERKVVLHSRKSAGKQNYEISEKTVHWVQALLKADRQKLQLLTEGTAANGGYLVPEDFINMVIEDRRDATVMRQLATVIPVSTDTIHLPNLASRPRAFWRSEGAVKATSTVSFGETVLTPYSLASIVGLSNELVADARLGGPIVSLVAEKMGRALAEEEDKAFWTGSGSGQPTGVDNYSFSTLTASPTDVSRADTLVRALFSLPQGYRNSAVWVANKNTWAKIATLKDSQNQYLLTGLGQGPTAQLRGRPIYEQNDIGDGKVFLGDFSYYYIADREGIQVDISTEATVASQSAFERNLTFVRVEERVDGEMTITQPVVEVQGIGGF